MPTLNCLKTLAPYGVFCVSIIYLVLCPALVSAQPCTLYKPGDIANARENIKRYKWAQNIAESWKNSVDYAMQQDREFFEDMISELTPWTGYGQNCPVCVGKQSSMGEGGLWRWSITDPDKLTCKYCGAVFPNPDYLETGKLVCPKMGQTLTYYETEEERAHPEDKSGKYALRWVGCPVHTSWSGIIRSNKTHWCVGKALPMAKLYALTGEVKYAEHAAWIIDRFARVYPNYLFHSYDGTFADCPPDEAAANMGKYGGGGKFPKDVIISAFSGRHQHAEYANLHNGFWGAGRYNTHANEAAAMLGITVAYDLIRDAKYADGRPIIDAEMRKWIVNDLIVDSCQCWENWDAINNKSGPSRALSAAVGILLKRPKSAARALDGFQQLVEQSFYFDGFCKESPSYSSYHLGQMRSIPEILRGYSDPEGYQPEKGARIDKLNPFEDIGRYRLALESMARMLAPDGRYPVIGDTHAGATQQSFDPGDQLDRVKGACQPGNHSVCRGSLAPESAFMSGARYHRAYSLPRSESFAPCAVCSNPA